MVIRTAIKREKMNWGIWRFDQDVQSQFILIIHINII